MTIGLSPCAKADIIRQFRYYLVEQDAPVTAVRFREAVFESMKRLKLQPRIGSLFRGSLPGLRSWPVRGFGMIRIYYLEAPGNLSVVRVLRQILEQERLSG